MSTKRAKSVNVPKPSIYFLVVCVDSTYPRKLEKTSQKLIERRRRQAEMLLINKWLLQPAT